MGQQRQLWGLEQATTGVETNSKRFRLTLSCPENAQTQPITTTPKLLHQMDQRLNSGRRQDGKVGFFFQSSATRFSTEAAGLGGGQGVPQALLQRPGCFFRSLGPTSLLSEFYPPRADQLWNQTTPPSICLPCHLGGDLSSSLKWSSQYWPHWHCDNLIKSSQRSGPGQQPQRRVSALRGILSLRFSKCSENADNSSSPPPHPPGGRTVLG